MRTTKSPYKWLAIAGVLGAALFASRVAAAAACTNDIGTDTK